VIGDRLLGCSDAAGSRGIRKHCGAVRTNPVILKRNAPNETRLHADTRPSIRTADRSVTETFDARVPLQITIEATAADGLQSEHVQCPPPRYQDNLVAIHGN
jgi:hypothetical protein